MLKSIDSPRNSASPQPLTSAFKSDPHRAVKNHFPPQSFSHRFTENKSKKSPFFFLGSGLMHSPCFLLFPTINFFFFSPWGSFTSLCQFDGRYIFIYISNDGRVKTFELCDHTEEKSSQPEEARPVCCKMTDLPREVCTSSVTRVEVAGHTQLRASMAYLNSSSHTT